MFEIKCLRQMSDSPQKGDTVIVFSSKTSRLSLSPPSMYRTPRNLGGMKPEKNGMKQLHVSALEVM